jgi:hypothetical protein
MKLFLISHELRLEYEFYDSAVVAAKDEDAARVMHPDTSNINQTLKTGLAQDWVDSYDQVNVLYLGEAAPGIAAGVICASFNRA